MQHSKKYITDRDELGEVLRKNLPTIKLENLEFIFSGWTSIIVDINNEYVAKFPRNDDKYNWLISESKLVDILQGYISLELPKRELYDVESPFFLHKKLLGLLLPEDALLKCTNDQQDNFLKSVAKFFKEVHSISIDSVRNLIPTIDSIPQESDIIPHFEKKFDKTDVEKARELIQKVNEIKFLDSDKVVGYFDFHGGNIVVDPDSFVIRGVFDFDEMAIRDFHFEFREVLLRYDEKYVEKIINYYSELTHREVDMNKIWLLHMVWYMWEYSRMIANPDKIAGIEGLDVEFHRNKIKTILDTKF